MVSGTGFLIRNRLSDIRQSSQGEIGALGMENDFWCEINEVVDMKWSESFGAKRSRVADMRVGLIDCVY